MFEALIAAFIAAKIKRYRIIRLFRSRSFWPVLAFFAVFIVMQIEIIAGNYEVVKYSSITCILGLLSFLVPIIRYKLYHNAFFGAICIFTGTILNKAVIAANSGKMPVFPTLSRLTGYAATQTFINSARYDDIHVLGSASSKLIFLSDIFDIGFNIMSLGDLFVEAYMFIITYSVIKYLNKADT